MKTLYNQFGSYEETVEFFNNSSMFSINLGLERINEFLSKTGNPQDSLKCIHIAGTNGKGSVLKYLENILTEAGYSVGSFTSPHLVDYTERITANQVAISKEDFTLYSNRIFQELSEHNTSNLTLFEFLTVLAFKYFKDRNVDIVLLETGLGGNYDATNVIEKPLVSVITRISYDHTEYLGDTLEKIATEKAGIIKENCPVVVNDDTGGLSSIQEAAERKKAPVHIASPGNYSITIDPVSFIQTITDLSNYNLYSISMAGLHQQENISLVMKVCDVLNTQGFEIKEKFLQQGLKKTTWRGRGELLKEEQTLLDGAHNPCGAKALRNLVDTYFFNSDIIWVTGTLNTKDSENILKELVRSDDTVILTEPIAQNATPVNELVSICEKLNISNKLYSYSRLSEAYKKAKLLLNENSLIVITGSLYLVGEFIRDKSALCREPALKR